MVNVIDAEFDGEHLLEVGLTVVDVQNLCVVQTYSLPLWTTHRVGSRIRRLTGWTTGKLQKCGIHLSELVRRLINYGGCRRLLVTDVSDEIASLERMAQFKLSPHRINVSVLFTLVTGKPSNLGVRKMLEELGLEFEGEAHRASVDSLNIARLFIRLLEISRG